MISTFNLYLEDIMQETLHGHRTSISIGDRPIILQPTIR